MDLKNIMQTGFSSTFAGVAEPVAGLADSFSQLQSTGEALGLIEAETPVEKVVEISDQSQGSDMGDEATVKAVSGVSATTTTSSIPKKLLIGGGVAGGVYLVLKYFKVV